MSIKLIRKTDVKNVLEAVSEVSGFITHDIVFSSKHMFTAWAGIGMFVARDFGASLEDAGKVFNRSSASCHAAIHKVRKAIKEGDVDIITTVNEVADIANNRRMGKRLDQYGEQP